MSDTIDTLADWNELIGQSSCCLIPSAPTPSIEYTSVQERRNLCGVINYEDDEDDGPDYSSETEYYEDGHSITRTHASGGGVTYKHHPFLITKSTSIDRWTENPHFNGTSYGDTDFTYDFTVQADVRVEQEASFSRRVFTNGESVTYSGNYKYTISTTKKYSLRKGVEQTIKLRRQYTGSFDKNGYFSGKLVELLESGETTTSELLYPIFPDGSTFTSKSSQSGSGLSFRSESQITLDQSSFEKKLTYEEDIVLQQRKQTTYAGTFTKQEKINYYESNPYQNPVVTFSGDSSYSKVVLTTTMLHNKNKDTSTYRYTSSGSFDQDGYYSGYTKITETGEDDISYEIGGPDVGGYSLKTVVSPKPIKPYITYSNPNNNGVGVKDLSYKRGEPQPRYRTIIQPIGSNARKITTYTAKDATYKGDDGKEYPDDRYPQVCTGPKNKWVGSTTSTETIDELAPDNPEAGITYSGGYTRKQITEYDEKGNTKIILSGSVDTRVQIENEDYTDYITYEGSLDFDKNNITYPKYRRKRTSNGWRVLIEEYNVIGEKQDDVIYYIANSKAITTSLNPLYPPKNKHCIYDRGEYYEEVTESKQLTYSKTITKNYLASADDDVGGLSNSNGTTSLSYSGAYSYSLNVSKVRTLKPNSPLAKLDRNELIASGFVFYESDSKQYGGSWDQKTGTYSGTHTNNGVTVSSDATPIFAECVLKTEGSLDLPNDVITYELPFNVSSDGEQIEGFTDPDNNEQTVTPSYKWNITVTAKIYPSTEEETFQAEDFSYTMIFSPQGTTLKEENDAFTTEEQTKLQYSNAATYNLGFPARLKWPNEPEYDPKKDTVAAYKQTIPRSSYGTNDGYSDGTLQRKIKSFYRWKVPPQYDGTSFRIVWDVLTVFTSQRSPEIQAGYTWDWTGNGLSQTASCLVDSNDLSWYSPVYTLEPPEEIGYKKIVNVRFTGTPNSPFGFKYQTTGETYP